MNKQDFEKIKEEYKTTIDLETLVQQHGYSLNKKKSTTRASFYEAGDDKILIYYNSREIAKWRYQTCNSPDDRGDIFNFLLNKFPVKYPNFKACFEHLQTIDPFAIDRVSTNFDKNKNIDRKPFVPIPVELPNEYNYLVRKRYIPLAALYSSNFVQRVFQTKHGYSLNKTPEETIHTSVFPLYFKNEIVGQFKRSSAGEQHQVEGSNKTIGAWQSNPNNSNVYAIFENPIDAISHHVINNSECNYFATCGSPSNYIISKLATIPKDIPGAKLLLCGDNDIHGQHFNLNFLTKYLSNTESAQFSFAAYKNDKTIKLSIADEDKKMLEHNKNMFSRLFDRTIVGIKLSDTQIDITSSYTQTSIENISNALINMFSIQTKFEIIKSVAKDFNKDLENIIVKRDVDIDKRIKHKQNLNIFGL